MDSFILNTIVNFLIYLIIIFYFVGNVLKSNEVYFLIIYHSNVPNWLDCSPLLFVFAYWSWCKLESDPKLWICYAIFYVPGLISGSVPLIFSFLGPFYFYCHICALLLLFWFWICASAVLISGSSFCNCSRKFWCSAFTTSFMCREVQKAKLRVVWMEWYFGLRMLGHFIKDSKVSSYTKTILI